MTQDQIAEMIAANPALALQFVAAAKKQEKEQDAAKDTLIPDSMRDIADEYVALLTVYGDINQLIHKTLDPMVISHDVQPDYSVMSKLLAPITHDLKECEKELPKSVREHCGWLADAGCEIAEGNFGVADNVVEAAPTQDIMATIQAPDITTVFAGPTAANTPWPVDLVDDEDAPF
jgi:hypothetical protein